MAVVGGLWVCRNMVGSLRLCRNLTGAWDIHDPDGCSRWTWTLCFFVTAFNEIDFYHSLHRIMFYSSVSSTSCSSNSILRVSNNVCSHLSYSLSSLRRLLTVCPPLACLRVTRLYIAWVPCLQGTSADFGNVRLSHAHVGIQKAIIHSHSKDMLISQIWNK